MPSPLGHAIGGVAAGWLIAGRHHPLGPQDLKAAAVFAVAAMAPDLDLLVGIHRGPTHGVGAACLAGLLSYAVTRRGLFAAAAGAAYGSHIFLDWLGSDTSAPIGVMALWPFSREYHASSLHLFYAVSRRYSHPDFWVANLRAVAWEMIVILPVMTLVAWLRRRGPG